MYESLNAPIDAGKRTEVRQLRHRSRYRLTNRELGLDLIPRLGLQATQAQCNLQVFPVDSKHEHIDLGIEGLIHISELAHQVIKHPRDVVNEGDELELKIIRIEPERRRLGLSLKQTLDGSEVEAVDESEDSGADDSDFGDIFEDND